MASTTFGDHAPQPAGKLLPQLVAEAMSAEAQADAMARLSGHVGERVAYWPMLSQGPHRGVLVEIGRRSAIVKWDSGVTSLAPFPSRLRLETDLGSDT